MQDVLPVKPQVGVSQETKERHEQRLASYLHDLERIPELNVPVPKELIYQQKKQDEETVNKVQSKHKNFIQLEPSSCQRETIMTTNWVKVVDLVLSWSPLEMNTAARDTRQDAPAAATETPAKTTRPKNYATRAAVGQLLEGHDD